MPSEDKVEELSEKNAEEQRFETRLAFKADRIMDILQLFVVYILLVLFGIGVFDLGLKIFSFVVTGKILAPNNIIVILDAALLLFLVVEVFRTSVAHLEDMQVLPLVIDVAIIGVVRSIITFRVENYSEPFNALMASSAYGLILIVLIGGFYIIHRQVRKPLEPHRRREDEE